jgi:hypothetical protein
MSSVAIVIGSPFQYISPLAEISTSFQPQHRFHFSSQTTVFLRRKGLITYVARRTSDKGLEVSVSELR